MGELGAELVAWVIFALALLAPLLSKTLRGDGVALLIVWAALLIRFGVALYNVYVGPTLGADVDAVKMQGFLARIVETGTYPEFFDLGLGAFLFLIGSLYQAFGVSLLLGEVCAVFAFSLSVLATESLLQLLGYQRYRSFVLFIFCLLPTSVLFGSVMLRESYQMLFFMVSMVFALRWHTYGKFLDLIAFVAAAAGIGFWHSGLVGYVPFLIILVLVWKPLWAMTTGLRYLSARRTAIFLLIGMGALLMGTSMSVSSLEDLGSLDKLASGDIAEQVAKYRSHPMSEDPGRTTYGVNFDPSSIASILVSVPLMFFLYMFAPLPWQVSASIDLYAALESFLRMFLLVGALWSLVYVRDKNQKHLIKLLLAGYLSLNFVWSLGTVNYGTGMRHHIVAFGALLILGAPFVHRFIFFRSRLV